MPGGRGNIKPGDNPKPFTKDYNRKDFEIWTEKEIHKKLDELTEWLMETVDIKDKKGNVIKTEDAGNCFYLYFLYKNGLYKDWIRYVRKKFDSVNERMKEIDEIQELKLQYLATYGITKEHMTFRVLMNKHGWREKSESVNKNENKFKGLDLKDLIDFKPTKKKGEDE